MASPNPNNYICSRLLYTLLFLQSPDTKESHDRMTHLESKVNDLQHDLSVSQYELGQVKVKLNVKDSELQSKNEEITRLQTKVQVC